MSGLIKLHLGAVLKHVLDLEPILIDEYHSDEDEEQSSESEEDAANEVGEVNDINGSEEQHQQNGPDVCVLPAAAAAAHSGLRDRRSTVHSTASKSAKLKLKEKQRKRRDREKRERKLRIGRGRDPYGDDLLDFSGPKLIHGAKSLLFFHQLMGQLNWIGLPLWMSIVYKILLFFFVCYVLAYRLGMSFFEMNIINQDYRNPIFIFISFLGFTTCVSQILVSFKTNLFDLCPMYKILITPKLCFIKVEVQHLLGSKSLGLLMLFMIYHGTLNNMLMCKGLDEFVGTFYLPTFLAGLFASSVTIFMLLGMSIIDLYIRSCFGHWLLALKSHLENRFMHFHRRQRKWRHQQIALAHSRTSSPSADLLANNSYNNNNNNSNNNNINSNHEDASALSMTTTTCDTISFTSGKSLNGDQAFDFITLDEIQRNLNNMDDHLEVLRSVQIGTLVHITLNAFLANGSLFLLAYHILANRSNSYHGFILLLISVNFIFIIFVCYSGDRWVFYALSSFVQTVEDEYFMQNDFKTVGPSGLPLPPPLLIQQPPTTPLDGRRDGGSTLNLASNSNGEARSLAATATAAEERSQAHNSHQQVAAHQLLLIKKKDVLFCREFLHQFENHLATPWTKLTVKSHLHMLRTFVTLIAAQIIFDHEH